MSLRGFRVVDGKILYDESYDKFVQRLLEKQRIDMAGVRVNPGKEAAPMRSNWTKLAWHPLVKTLSQKLSEKNCGENAG